MAQKMYNINLPEFAEYVFHVMSTTPDSDKLKLTPQELRYFADAKQMKKFASNETLEKRLLLLAKLEVPFCVVVGKRKNVDSVLNEVYTQYKIIEKRHALIKAMSREKVFVFSTNEVLLGLQMAAQNSHSKVYVLNYDYVKMNEKLQKSGITTVGKDTLDALNGFDILSRAIIASTQKLSHAQAIFEVSPMQLKILISLYPYRNTFANINKIYEIMGEGERQRGLAKMATEMVNDGYLTVLPGFDIQRHKLKSYTLSPKGLNVAMKFLKYISELSLYPS